MAKKTTIISSIADTTINTVGLVDDTIKDFRSGRTKLANITGQTIDLAANYLASSIVGSELELEAKLTLRDAIKIEMETVKDKANAESDFAKKVVILQEVNRLIAIYKELEESIENPVEA